MPLLFGRDVALAEVRAQTGSLAQVAGIQLVSLEDGPGRGVRILQADNADGLSFRVAIDRGFDLVSASYRGIPIGWQSPVGVQRPGLHHPELDGGVGFLRAFSGLLVTCGLDHYGSGEEGSSAHFNYPYRQKTVYPMHGRIGHVPGRLVGHGIDEAQGLIWCEGVVTQASVFGEVLELHRRIEAPLGGSEVHVRDTVTNRGFRPTPHAILYHYNFGYPMLSAESEFLAPVREVQWMPHEPKAQDVGYRYQAPPRDDFVEQVYLHDMASNETGQTTAALINEELRDGMAVSLTYDKGQLPTLLQWQCLQSGLYALGIEPGTNYLQGRAASEERGEIIWLAPGDKRNYETRLAVHDGKDAIGILRDRITDLHVPVDNFTTETMNYPRLRP